MGSDAINCVKQHKALIGSTNSSSHNLAYTKKQKLSTSPYRTAVTGTSVAKVFNGCGLSTHNTEHHNWGNCQRRTHPEFKSQEHVAYANSTAGWAATTRRAATGLPDLLHIDKTYSAPNNNVAAAGFDCGGGRGSRGRDGHGNRGTTT